MMINHQRVMRIGMIIAVAGVLAGCGVTQAAHRTIQDIAAMQSGAQYGANGQPINRAALKKSYGKYFPNLVITAAAVGAPAQPPFSLSAYPANGSITWGPAIPMNKLPAWGKTADEDAATWFMEANGNNPVQIVRWGNPAEHFALKGSSETYNGIQQQYMDASEGYVSHPKNASTAASYVYRTWATITQTWAMSPTAYQKAEGITITGKVLHVVAATVTINQISAWAGHFYKTSSGPTNIFMVDMAKLGWRYGDNSGFGSNGPRLPGSYAPHPVTP